jgi:hypothetical protein
MADLINKYSNGKIYKVIDISYTKCYYGSTTQELSSRMTAHRRDYKRFKLKDYKYLTVFEIFDEFGITNCKIELVEMFPSVNKSELEAREGFYIKNNECVNKVIPGRTVAEYYHDNKEKMNLKSKEYFINHREKCKENNILYRTKNKEKISEQRRKYRERNKEKIALNSKASYLKRKESQNAVNIL